MKVLAIGNSFSQDATRYLHQIAASAGTDMTVYNLYISGCSLQTHYLNMLENSKKYSFEFNGVATGIFLSIKEALMAYNWDYITLQQVSTKSAYYESYQPYLNELAAYVRKYCPHSRIMIHQTWAYEEGSDRLLNIAHFDTVAAMLAGIRESYQKAAEEIDAYGIIPSGEAMFRVLENGLEKIHRDTYHATYGPGRYLLGLIWFGTLTGKSVDDVSFAALDEEVSDETLRIVKETAKEILSAE